MLLCFFVVDAVDVIFDVIVIVLVIVIVVHVNNDWFALFNNFK